MTNMKKVFLGAFVGLIAAGSLFALVAVMQPKRADALDENPTIACIKWCGGDRNCIERMCK